jgi:pyruvate,orthophosphate dikinase
VGGASRLSQKGAYLCAIAKHGYPVPAGFILPAEIGVDFDRGRLSEDELDQLLRSGLSFLEQEVGNGFGNGSRPLLVSVRSGTAISVPRLTETVLNVGITRDLVTCAVPDGEVEVFHRECYVRFLASLIAAVRDADADEHNAARKVLLDDLGAAGTAAALGELAGQYEAAFLRQSGVAVPADPFEQLRLAVRLAFAGWRREGVQRYLGERRIKGAGGVAVIVQQMVFGNMGGTSGAGVGFSRSPATGEARLYGEYMPRGQAADALTGRGIDLADIARLSSDVHAELVHMVKRLERDFRDMQDFEFTIEGGKLFLLQTRPGCRMAVASVRIACDLHDEGIVTAREAGELVNQSHINELRKPVFPPAAKTTAVRIGRGLPAAPGVGVGEACFDLDEFIRRASDGASLILVMEDAEALLRTRGDELAEALSLAQGIVAGGGSMSGVVSALARQNGLSCVMRVRVSMEEDGRSGRIGNQEVRRGDVLSVDGTSGEVFYGIVRKVAPEPDENLSRILNWKDNTGGWLTAVIRWINRR